MPQSGQRKSSPVFFASNLDDSRDAGIYNSTAEYLRRLHPTSANRENAVIILRLEAGLESFQPTALLRIWHALREALAGGAEITVEGYKAALFCLSLMPWIRKAGRDQIRFVVHDAGSHSHMRLAAFWARRGNPRALYRLARAGLDLLIENAVLRNRPVVVVSRSEASKIRFTSRISVWPPSGMRDASQPKSAEVVTSARDLVLYADLRVAHLRQSVLESMRALDRACHARSAKLPYRLTVLGRRSIPPRCLRLANRIFAGGVVDLRYTLHLAETLSSADMIWLPDLVGSGVKNRTLDALRHGNHVIASEAALEGVELARDEWASSSQVERYESVGELARMLV